MRSVCSRPGGPYLRWRPLCLAILAAAVLAVSGPAAPAAPTLPAPTGLRAFLLRADEALVDSFPRTPSFAWTPYEAAQSYEFELATSKTFDESSVVWSTASRTAPLRVPAVSIPVALPWMTGNPYALYAHVRARVRGGVTPWSAPFGFNMRWKTLPEKMVPEYPGLVRWKPIEGATSYELWFVDAGKVIQTTTNVADEREYFTFHQGATWTSIVQWRVRAVRKIYGTLPSGLPVVSHGPWSETFVSENSDFLTGPLSLEAAVSDTASSNAPAKAHSLTPAFAFSGDQALDGSTARLYRVYVATDRQCVNVVFKGAVVGSPAYAPRMTGPLALPTTATAVTDAESAYLANGSEAGTFMADYTAVTTNEQSAPTTSSSGTSSSGTSSGTGPAGTGGTAGATSTIPADFGATGALVDLWDSGWPTGRYYWTAVPVKEVTTSGAVQYFDAEVPEDACAAGRVREFGKTSQPATTSSSRPYASGLSPEGELTAATTAVPTFYRAALIAWQPALGATGYEVQWSRSKYPWRPASKTPFFTAATSVLLEGLQPGRWYYRVRGIDPYVPGPVKQMTWSEPVEIRLAKPTFLVDDATATATPVKPKAKKKK